MQRIVSVKFSRCCSDQFESVNSMLCRGDCGYCQKQSEYHYFWDGEDVVPGDLATVESSFDGLRIVRVIKTFSESEPHKATATLIGVMSLSKRREEEARKQRCEELRAALKQKLTDQIGDEEFWAFARVNGEAAVMVRELQALGGIKAPTWDEAVLRDLLRQQRMSCGLYDIPPVVAQPNKKTKRRGR